MRLFTKTLFTSLAGCLLLVLAQFAAGPAQAQTEPAPIKTAWLGEHEAFPVWLAKEKGWDKEAGIAIEMLRFDTGRALIEGMLAYKWVVGACGALPAVASPLKDNYSIIALANDESAANVVLVRSESPVLQKKGVNPDYPNVYGDAQTVAKRTILCPRETSAHYTLVRWLYAIGLTEKDVRIQFMDPAQAVGAFRKGLGDALVVWAPWYDALLQEKFAIAARGNDCAALQPIVLLANNGLKEGSSGQIAALLACYMRAVQHIAAAAPADLAASYQTFLKEWAGRDADAATVAEELNVHKFLSLSEQLALFDTSRGESQLRRELKKMAGLFGVYTPSPEVQDNEPKVPHIDTHYLRNCPTSW